ncbi:MAG: XRE family transcriptional regulator [Bacteroidales bacterium]|nr:XRE family transcriptional regulator [Bacteroidales bacterium]MCM1147333.1 XRE family transcriptional regulator [Bacteroidales bacterium]MCM1206232.1 XRE family transcriptional regulator [Bacillota bacterium]
MTETINDRIEMLVNSRFDGNKAAFEKAIDFPKNSMSSYLGKQRRSKPSVDMVTKIITTLGVDARWLLIGEESTKKEIRTEGDYSPASDSGNVSVTVGDAVLAERVKALEALLAEKERLIKVYEKMMEGK